MKLRDDIKANDLVLFTKNTGVQATKARLTPDETQRKEKGKKEMKSTPSQEELAVLTSRISRRAETLSALSAEDANNQFEDDLIEFLKVTRRLQFEDAMLDFLRLTGRLDVVLENHVEELIANRVLTER